ncbi:putative membrane protein [Nostocoides australiense Ben110]|uniref:Putative membrane protein n=1 Tax=Nostocoides australiense Ben110 TaxID=1193182 RepID=W6JTM6_9MICO|nr:DUF58 domain-containing protein [Tetrasphaera australiensis]CCH72172.1 putative membrane protein [Tetrasphaera australiensis Ben110]
MSALGGRSGIVRGSTAPRRRRRRLTDALTLRGRCFLAAGVALMVCGLLLGFRDITRIGFLVAGLPLLMLLLARRQRLSMRTTRTVTPSIVPIDQWSDVNLRVENPGPATTPILMAEEQLDYALGDRPRFVVPRMAPGAEHLINYRVRSTVRGRHHLGPLGLRVKDPFDMTLRLAVVRGTGELIVLPRIVSLSGTTVAGGLGNEGTIPHMIALHGEDDVSVREHREGDDLRRIHWPATARTGDLMVRQEDRPATRRIVLLLDDRATVERAPRGTASFEWAVTAAASIANEVIGSGTNTFLALGGEIRSGHGGEHLRVEEALTELAVAELREPVQFVTTMALAADAAASGALCIAVVAAMAERDTERLARVRSPGSPGMALVLPVSDSDDPVAASATATGLRERGWSAVVITPGTSLVDAWAAAAASPALQGGRR